MAEKKGFDLSSVLKNVSSPDTGREQIEYIDIDLLASDANNFYSLDGVSELAANIELVGLQQPLRVRQSPIDSKMYTIVSGHRRCAALRLLVKDGREDLRAVPCIVEQAAESSAMQELRLIYANADTRKMSSADISRQAERVEMLLYQLKEEGVEFPGRMRDHVAEACKVSKSKLARLKVIREKLRADLRGCWENGKLSETVAYAIAQGSMDWQDKLAKYRLGRKSVSSLGEWDVRNFYEYLGKLDEKRCSLDGGLSCTNGQHCLDKYGKRPGYYIRCFEKCCADCYDLATCEYSCDKCLAQKAEAQSKKAEDIERREAANKLLREEREEREKLQALENRKFWLRLSEAADAAGVGAREIMTVADWGDVDESDVEWIESLMDGSADEVDGGLEWFVSDDMTYLVPLADLLGCSIDYLFGRDGYDGRGAVCEWQTGTPPAPGRYYCCFDCAGTLLYENAYWQGGDWYFGRGFSNKVGAECVAWYKLPEDMEA